MSAFPTSLADVQAAIQQKGHRWHAAHTSMSTLEYEEALKYLGYTPGPDEPSLHEREQRAAATAGVAAPTTDTSTTTTPATAAAPTTAAAAAPGTSATGAGAPPAGASAAVSDWRNHQGMNWVTPILNQSA